MKTASIVVVFASATVLGATSGPQGGFTNLAAGEWKPMLHLRRGGAERRAPAGRGRAAALQR